MKAYDKKLNKNRKKGKSLILEIPIKRLISRLKRKFKYKEIYSKDKGKKLILVKFFKEALDPTGENDGKIMAIKLWNELYNLNI